MRTPITYYGGKQRMVPMLLKILPPHKIYCEPFFGGGALFWAKQPSYLEAINDSDNNVINFLKVLQNKWDQLSKRIDGTLLHETQFWHAQRIYFNPKKYSGIERAWAFWMVSNFSFASKIGGGFKLSNGTSGSHAGRLMVNKKAEFTEAFMKRLQEVNISCRDALRVIDERDSINTLFYLDPPYVGSCLGHFSFYSQGDFDILIHKLQSIKGKFILSSYPNKYLKEAVDAFGWSSTPVEMRLSAGKNNRSDGTSNRRKIECITTNFNNYDLFSEL